MTSVVSNTSASNIHDIITDHHWRVSKMWVF